MVYLMSNFRSGNDSSCNTGTNIPYSKHSVNLIELVSLEFQLFFHARDVCII